MPVVGGVDEGRIGGVEATEPVALGGAAASTQNAGPGEVVRPASAGADVGVEDSQGGGGGTGLGALDGAAGDTGGLDHGALGQPRGVPQGGQVARVRWVQEGTSLRVGTPHRPRRGDPTCVGKTA